MNLEVMDLEQLARYLQRDLREVSRLASRGYLPGRKVGGEWRFSRAEINHWVETQMHAYTEQELAEAKEAVEIFIRQRRVKVAMENNPEFKKYVEEQTAKSEKAVKEFSMLEGVQAMPNGVLLKVNEPGSGKFLAGAKKVTFSYDLAFADGTPIRSSAPDKPVTLQTWEMLPAVQEVLSELRIGEKATIVLPADKAYGLAGKPPLIGPNQAIMIDFHIVGAE